MTKPLLALATALSLATPAFADPTVGLGLSFAFGGGKVETGIGLRVFSDDEEDSFVGSAGVDYMFGSQSWRPTVGAAYLGNNSYIGADVGFGINGGGIAFGLGALVGGLIPSSRKEQELAEQAKEQAQPLMAEAKEMAQESADHLKPAAQEAADSMKVAAQEGADHVKGDAQTAVDDVRSQTESSVDDARADDRNPF